ncbi:uncharacterized protein CMU_036150 [Cryptosporidium muris RN66]|uniref:PH domain-containing protein n=1 Tax=Cryptosporidium muris (strain RN66) TaxID=441375 RepID=B6AGV1_CRYMR|nr:uncharacterized protein CMU_036150 [Cryptosporidium muris RN66]EEA07442.1 hypothetical protein, conserved [Cryptosporidium muris RN66]|eukprot:XP_002141791.1 hypothetical protein [Cryptosporidium muris RN66]
MGNTTSCFERWGKRRPDGPLIKPLKDGQHKSSSGLHIRTIGGTNTADIPVAVVNSSSNSKGVHKKPSIEISNDIKPSKSPDIQETSSEDEYEEDTTSKNILSEQILEYRKKLTKTAKLMYLSFFNVSVTVTLSSDGSQLEWYKTSVNVEDIESRGPPLGSVNLNDIESVEFSSGTEQNLEINMKNKDVLSFQFKNREERSNWKKTFDKYIRLIRIG